MAKDYFQDITPPESDSDAPLEHAITPPPSLTDRSEEIPIRVSDTPPARGIRNISSSRPRPKVGGDFREAPAFSNDPVPPHTKGFSRWILWGVAAIALIVVGVLALFAFRDTTVRVVPKSHTVVFDPSTTFTAFPEATAATGTLTYTVQTSELEDSEVVASQGTTHAETKASGSITVYNEYSDKPVKLIKNTRFQTPDGLVFRTPAEIVVPGRKGSIPGQITVTVVADKVGEKYNIAPVSKFTLPGLTSSPDMYTKVYAKSTAPFSGGFVGDQPAVAPGALEAALSSVRARLEEKARAAATGGSDTTIFPDMITITYQDLPNTSEAGGGVRIHQKARIEVPVFSSDAFAKTIARSVSADAETADIMLVAGEGFGARLSDTSAALGSSPIEFGLTGTAQLVWKIDEVALAEALAGRSQDAFMTIVNEFPGIQEAHARIEPFWKNTFPAAGADIKIQLEDPKPTT